jgi:hypothetical protein
VEEIHFDLNENEEVELVCPFYNGCFEREKTKENNHPLCRDLSCISDFVPNFNVK